VLTLIFGFIAAVSRQSVSAQTPVADPHPLVERVAFKGVRAVNANDLQNTISTQPSRCRAFFLTPICLLTHNHLFESRHYLDHAELKQDVVRIKVFYWLRGYRHTQVDTAIVKKRRGVEVAFNVAEGPATLIQTIALQQPGVKLSSRRLRGFGLPGEGDPIDLTRIDSLRVGARRALWDQGYANAVVTDSVQPVDSLRVALDLTIDSRARTTVDSVAVVGNEHVTTRTVRRLVGLGHGDLYKRADLLEAQRRLYKSELFRQTLVVAPDSADTAKVVVVTVREAPPRASQLGVGFNTVEFGQTQANLTLYNFFGSARRVDLRSTVGNLFSKSLYGKKGFGSAAPFGVTGVVDPKFLSPTWQLSAAVTQPWLFSTRNAIGVSVFSNRRSIPNIVIDRGTGASATLTRTLLRGLPLSLTYRYERTRIEAGELYFCVDFGYCKQATIRALQQSNSMSPLVLSLRGDRTDDPLQPTSGYTAKFDAEHASAMTASDWRYNRVEGDLSTYLKMGKRTLVLRGHAGRVAALSSALNTLGSDPLSNALLHPRTRFYAGGSRSVRGFAEGQLGPRVLTIDPEKLVVPTDSSRGTPCTPASLIDRTCDPNIASSSQFVPRPVGGNTLLEGTIEYRIPLGRTIGGALFVDGGRVGGNNLGPLLHARSVVTPGIGFRYASPIGPVRIDLGIRPRGIEELGVVTEVVENGEARLVELTTPKKYDPMKGPHGFIGRMTQRLQLHLYIGEAY
jgi:outer membrane protein insertion porin family